MKRADLMLSLSAVVLGAAYVLGSPAVALLGALMLAHYSLARASFSPSLEVERTLPERAVEGEPAKATVRVRNLSSAPGTVTILERSTRVVSKPVKVPIGGNEEKVVEQTLVPRAKGRLELRAEAIFEDELGLFAKGFPVVDRGRMTVFPSQKTIRQALAERRQVEALAEVGGALGMGAETMEFEELREFLPGDDVTRIDWKATSRLQELIIRVFRRESMADVWLLINVDRRFRRELKPGKVDYLVVITAQLVTYFRRFGHGVNAIAYDEGDVVRVVEHADGLALIQKLGLSGEKGLPALRPSRVGGLSRVKRLISKLRGAAHGVVRAALRVPEGSYVVIVDDPGLHPEDVLAAARLLERKNSKVVLVYPNPVYFFPKDSLTREDIEALYRAYRERKELMKRVMAHVKVVEVGPADLLPEVVSRL